MKDYRIELRWGILFSLISMVWMFVEKNFLNWHDEHINSQFGNHLLLLVVSFAIVYYLALKEKKEHYYKGKMSWKRAFLSGAIIAVVIAILSPLTEYFNYHYISPDYFDKMIAYQTQKENHPMSLESAQKLFNMKSFIMQGVFTSFSYGMIMGAIIGLFVRTKKK